MSTRRNKSRPTLSCTRCRERKVKCDRVKPCQACCIHGEPGECVYEEGVQDRLAIAQAQEIQRLRREVGDLRRKLEESALNSDESSISQDASSSSSGDDTKTPLSEYADSSDERSLLPISRSTGLGVQNRVQGVQPSFSMNVFLANFMDKFLDKTSPATGTGVVPWLRTVAQATPNSKLLSNAFYVVSFFHCGIMSCDPAWEVEGRRLYGNVLRDLQRELDDSKRSLQPDVLYTLLVLTIHEILYFQHPTAWLSHISGAAKLFQMRGPNTFMKGLDRETFLNFRIFDLSLNIFRRKPSFLSFAPWKTQQWRSNERSQDLMEAVIDNMVDIPGYFGDSDTLNANISSGTFSADELDNQCRQLWASLNDFDRRMQAWREQWIEPWPGNHVRPVQEFDPRCVGHQELFERSLWYADDRVARAMCMYAAGRLLLSRVDTRPERASPVVLDELISLIVDSTNFLLAVTYDYISIINMLFPLRVAYFTLHETNPQRFWIQDILWRISARFKLSFATQLITPVLPGKNEKILLA